MMLHDRYYEAESYITIIAKGAPGIIGLHRPVRAVFALGRQPTKRNASCFFTFWICLEELKKHRLQLRSGQCDPGEMIHVRSACQQGVVES
jgi:hypothetical protein